MTLLKIDNIVKEYRRGERANDKITLSVENGEVFGLLGPNGAGKTTLVNQVIGLIAPTSGRILISGVDIVSNPDIARQACSFQPQSQVPIDGVTPLQAIELVGQIRGGKKSEVKQRARALIDALNIQEWAEKPGETLSGGVRRLTAFCMAAAVPGQLVILDEPTNDVDPLRRRLLWKEVRNLADLGSTVLLVTHNVLEAERSVDRLAIIDHGKVIGSGTPASLKGFENGFLRLELILEPFAISPELPTFLTKVTRIGQRIISRVEMNHVDQALDWAHQLRKMESIEEFSIGPATLEDVYVSLVGQPDTSQISNMEVNHVFA